MSVTATTPNTQNIKRTDCWLMTIPFKCLKGQFTSKSEIQVPCVPACGALYPSKLLRCVFTSVEDIDCRDDCRLSNTMRLKKYVKEKLNSSVSIHQSWFKIIHRPCWEQLHVRTVDQRLALADIKHLSNYWHQWFFCHIVDKIWVKSSAVVQLPLTQHCLTGHTAKQLVRTCIQWM